MVLDVETYPLFPHNRLMNTICYLRRKVGGLGEAQTYNNTINDFKNVK